MTGTNFAIVSNIRDAELRNAVYRSLQNDGRFSEDGIRYILKLAPDGKGVTDREYLDRQTILKQAKTVSSKGRTMIESFLQRHGRPSAKGVSSLARQLTQNFNLLEFACKDGTAVPAN